MRKALLIVTGVFALIAGMIGIGLWQYHRTVDLEGRTVTVVVEKGDSFSRVARQLAKEGVVVSDLVLRIPARMQGVDRKLVPGRYDFAGEISPAAVLDRFREGDFLRIKITIPEGTPVWGVASALARGLELDSAVIVGLNRDTAFLRSLGKPSLEGYLYPETYYFPWGITAPEAVRTMVEMFDRMTEKIWPQELPMGLSRHEVVTLASIIEAETPLAKERGLVASVYVNRLKNGWKLDADPTVIYGMGGLDRPLYRGDLKRDTPYNTYLRTGLPPTPINSPGLLSIQAALQPQESEYFFFVADDTGGHYFSRTNDEHNRAQRRIRLERSRR